MKNTILVFGNEEFFVELRAKNIIDNYKDRYPVEVIEAEISTFASLKCVLDKCISSIQNLDFFCSKKCIWLKNVQFLSNNSIALTDGAKRILERWTEAVKTRNYDDIVFIISACPVDKRLKWFNFISSFCEIYELKDNDFDNYVRFLLKKLIKEEGIDINHDACELLIQKLNKNPRAIVNEVKKLACIKNFNESITVDDVQNNTQTLINDVFYEPVDAFYEKDKMRYIRTLRNHFLLKKEMHSILSMMQNRNRLLIQLAFLQLNKGSKDNLEHEYEKFFGKISDKNSFCIFSQNKWYVSKLKCKFTIKTLIDIQKELVKIFDLFMRYPKKVCDWMESLVKFF